MNLKEARSIAAKEYGIYTKAYPFLLSQPDANPKISKNMKQGVLTAPLHLAPARLSGYETCPMRSDGCTKACLHTAGNPAHMAGKERARIAKTKLYFEKRDVFLELLKADLHWLKRKAERKGLKAGVRLNATSDIPWERVRFDAETSVIGYAVALGVTCYDYTKIAKRALSPIDGYHLTFSRTEANDAECLEVLKAGGNVAVVFAKELPKEWRGYPVIDGDYSDWRPEDPAGVVIGLKAKGDAKKDTSGFVVR